MMSKDRVHEEKDCISFQRERYDLEAERYDEEHDNVYSQRYRTEFIRNRLFSFHIEGLNTLDAMSASGIETGFLLSKNAIVTGLDISSKNAALYREKWNRPCHEASIHDTGLQSESFDVIYISGGLHHVIPILDSTIKEVYRLLKPGGYFAFVEPNKDTWLNLIRMFWYKKDSRFHETEAALSYQKQLKPFLELGFEEITSFSGGNLAYLLISQAHMIGTPVRYKKSFYTLFTNIEKLSLYFPFAPRLYFAGVWRKLK